MVIPKGFYLLVAGKQMEWLTGRSVTAPKYAVTVKNEPIDAINEAKELGLSLWRASSAFYAYLAPNVLMEPIGSFKIRWMAENYFPIRARDYINKYAETNPKEMK